MENGGTNKSGFIRSIFTAGNWRLECAAKPARSMFSQLVPFLMDFFAVPMGVNHRQHKNNEPARQQNYQDRFIPPDFADKLGQVGFHATANYTTSLANVRMTSRMK